MTLTLPPLYGIIGAVTGYVAANMAVQQAAIPIPTLIGAAAGGILGLLVWYVSDAPMTNRGLVGDTNDR